MFELKEVTECEKVIRQKFSKLENKYSKLIYIYIYIYIYY